MKDSRIRSFVKGISWRFIATSTTMAVAYALTGNVEIMLTTGLIDVIAKLLFYYVHERAWGRVAWGRGVLPIISK
jgi:adenylylsulfate kinase